MYMIVETESLRCLEVESGLIGHGKPEPHGKQRQKWKESKLEKTTGSQSRNKKSTKNAWTMAIKQWNESLIMNIEETTGNALSLCIMQAP